MNDLARARQQGLTSQLARLRNFLTRDSLSLSFSLLRNKHSHTTIISLRSVRPCVCRGKHESDRSEVALVIETWAPIPPSSSPTRNLQCRFSRSSHEPSIRSKNGVSVTRRPAKKRVIRAMSKGERNTDVGGGEKEWKEGQERGRRRGIALPIEFHDAFRSENMSARRNARTGVKPNVCLTYLDPDRGGDRWQEPGGVEGDAFNRGGDEAPIVVAGCGARTCVFLSLSPS